jgi:hypothetical protein
MPPKRPRSEEAAPAPAAAAPPPAGADAALIELRRRVFGGASGGGSASGGGAGAEAAAAPGPSLAALVRTALLWLRPAAFVAPAEDALPAAEQSEAQALRAFPSLHSCLACNVLAFLSLLREGAASRFWALRAIPPVYLSLALNFEREEASGELLTVEPLAKGQQREARREARAFPQVREALGAELAAGGCDWLRFLQRELELEPLWEVWRGDDWRENIRGAAGAAEAPPELAAGESAVRIFSLRRTTLGGFAAAARASGSRAGVALAFRLDAPEFQPFGVWFAWLRCGEGAGEGEGEGEGAGEELVVADLQNSGAHASLAAAVESLHWEQAPRNECFFAAIRS